MYDRRVVRGNTFAALVIPVSMQADPVQEQKQRAQQQARQQRMQEQSYQQQQQQYQQQMDGSQTHHSQQQHMGSNQSMGDQQYQQPRDWDELSDHSRQVDEDMIEPDYYIDQAPRALFIPEEKGVDKQCLVERTSLFDFELEAEPVLQALCGRALEHGLIEVKEEWETKTLASHKRRFKQLRESELIATQRLEAANTRRMDEVERRNLQVRTHGMVKEESEKKMLSRLFAKDYLKMFKRDQMQDLTNMGITRSTYQLSFGMDYLPFLMGQVEYDTSKVDVTAREITELVQESCGRVSKEHRSSIQREMKRRQDVIAAKVKKDKDEAEAKRRRKERRNALREAYRLAMLRDQVNNEILAATQKADYSPAVPVYDIRCYQADAPAGIHVLGGFTTELILVFSQIYDWLHSNPAMADFKFGVEAVEKLLTEMIIGNEFPDGTCVIGTKSDIKATCNTSEDPDVCLANAIAYLGEAKNIHSFGLNFFMQNSKDFMINKVAIQEIFGAISKIGLQESAKEVEVAEDADDAAKEAANTENEAIKTKNEALTKVQAKIGFVTVEKQEPAEVEEGQEPELLKAPLDPEDYEWWEEKLFLKVNNYREPEGAAPVEEPKPMDRR